MAYNGALLSLVTQSIEGAFNVFAYFTADNITSVTAAHYFADGVERGMGVGDWLFIQAGGFPFLGYVAAESGLAVTVEVAVLSITGGGGFPTTNPGPGTGIIWNNAGFLCVA